MCGQPPIDALVGGERRAGSVTLVGERLDDATASGRGARVPICFRRAQIAC